MTPFCNITLYDISPIDAIYDIIITFPDGRPQSFWLKILVYTFICMFLEHLKNPHFHKIAVVYLNHVHFSSTGVTNVQIVRSVVTSIVSVQ